MLVPIKPMLVVDAYNALHVTGVLPPELAGMEVQELAALVAVSRWSAFPVLLVCDGSKPRRPPSELGARHGRPGRGAAKSEEPAPSVPQPIPTTIRVVYAGAGKSADDHIAALVKESSHPTRLTVVSNDRQVQQCARKRRASVLSSDEWLAQLAVDHKAGQRSPRRQRGLARGKPHGPISPADAEEWLRIFGQKP